jgi:hypothetical protein
MRALFRWWPPVLAAAVLVLALASRFWADEPDNKANDTQNNKALEQKLYTLTRTIINTGADIANRAGDSNGCYRFYQGSLMTLRGLLDSHPELQKVIDDAMASAGRTGSLWSRGLILNRALFQIRAKVKPRSAARNKTQDKASPDKKPRRDKKKTDKAPRDLPRDEKKVTDKARPKDKPAKDKPEKDAARDKGEDKPEKDEARKDKPADKPEKDAAKDKGEDKPTKDKADDKAAKDEAEDKGEKKPLDKPARDKADDKPAKDEARDKADDKDKVEKKPLDKPAKDDAKDKASDKEEKKPLDKPAADKKPADKDKDIPKDLLKDVKKEEKPAAENKAEAKKPKDQAEVIGKVTFKGQPLAAGTIKFTSADGKTVISGKIAADGSYAIAKLPVGDYRVSVTSKKPVLPAKYGDPKTSSLTFTVAKGKSTFDIQLN